MDIPFMHADLSWDICHDFDITRSLVVPTVSLITRCKREWILRRPEPERVFSFDHSLKRQTMIKDTVRCIISLHRYGHPAKSLSSRDGGGG